MFNMCLLCAPGAGDSVVSSDLCSHGVYIVMERDKKGTDSKQGESR